MPAARAGTEEEVASLALSLLKEPGVALLSEDNARARAARKWFGQARAEVLRRHDWNFAKTWAKPAADANPSLGPLAKRFPLPADCLKVRFVEDLKAGEWEIEGGTVTVAGASVEAVILVTNEAAPLVCYTRDVVNLRLWDPQALTALAHELAGLIAGELGKSANDIAFLRAEGEDKIDQAAMRDAREAAPREISRDTSWIRARRGWRR